MCSCFGGCVRAVRLFISRVARKKMVFTYFFVMELSKTGDCRSAWLMTGNSRRHSTPPPRSLFAPPPDHTRRCRTSRVGRARWGRWKGSGPSLGLWLDHDRGRLRSGRSPTGLRPWPVGGAARRLGEVGEVEGEWHFAGSVVGSRPRATPLRPFPHRTKTTARGWCRLLV